MTTELLLPGRRLPAPEPPERIALNMAFGAGNPAILGDKSRYRSHGAITTATVAAGLHGLCLDFNSANPDYVTIPAAHTQLDFTAEDFSMIMRVNPDTVVPAQSLFDRGTPGNLDGYRWYLWGGGSMRLYTCQGGVVQNSQSNAVIVAGNWYTIGLSRAGASVRLYVNGVDQTSVAGVHIDPTTSPAIGYIGVESPLLSWPLDGRMEFFRVFRHRALALSEHLAWHNALV